MSRVAPRGTPPGVSVRSVDFVIVSDELLRLRDSLTVDTLFEDTTLACFSWEIAVLFLPLMVPPASSSAMCPFPLVTMDECCDGVTEGFLETIRLTAAGDDIDEVERTEAEDGVLFAIGLSLEWSTGEGGGLFAFIGGVAGFAALDGGRLLGRRGVDVFAVLTLTVDTDEAVEPRRLRPAELGVMSVLAVSNAVDLPSLVEDNVEAGRDSPEGGLSMEGPALVLRIVDACDLTDAAVDLIREVRPLGDTLLDTLRLLCTVLTLALGVREGDVTLSDSATLDRTDEALLENPGVNFESGRCPDGTPRCRVVVVVVVAFDFEIVEYVLLATDFSDALEGLTESVPCLAVDRLRTPVRSECILPVSLSSALAMLGRELPRAAPPLDVAEGETGL